MTVGAEKDDVWIVTLAPEASLESVTKALSKLGFVILRTFDKIGSVEVRGTELMAEEARKLPGVSDVSRNVTFDLGPSVDMGPSDVEVC